MKLPAFPIIRSVLVLTLVITVISCDYKAKDRYFRDLNPHPVAPVMNLNINSNTDTIYVRLDQWTSTFRITTGITRKQWLVVYLNDVVHDTTCNSKGEFMIDLRSVISSAGTYKLKVRVYVATGTGSIGDKLDAEHFLYEKVWWLIVSGNPALGAVITSAAPDNGNLRISWTPFKGIGFGCYVLLRTLKNEWNYDTIAVVNDLTRTWVYDTTYIGQASTYQLKVYTSFPPEDGFDLISASTYDYYYGFPVLTIQPYNEKDLKVTWNKSIFVHHMSKYKIQILLEDNSMYTVNQDIPNTDSTSYIFVNPQFTFRYDFRLIFFPFKSINEEWDADSYSQRASAYSGTPSFSCNGLYAPAGPDMWFQNNGLIDRYTVALNKVTDSLYAPGGPAFHGLTVSPNDKYLLSMYDQNAWLYNIQTHSSIITSLGSISPSSTAWSSVNIADNGIGVISDYYNLFLYDFVNHHLLNTATPSGEFWMYGLSADGQYIYIRNNYKYYCYRFTATEYTMVWDDPNHLNEQFYFDARDASHAVLYSGNTLSVVNISDWSPQLTLSLTANNLINIDFGAGRILGYTDEYIRIYSLATGALLQELPTSIWLNGILLKDDYLYSVEGHKLKVF